MKSFVSSIQIGKAGLTPGILNSIKLALKTRKIVKVKTLKSSPMHNREDIKKLAEEIKNKLPEVQKTVIIGFTITLKKGFSLFKNKKQAFLHFAYNERH